MVSLNDVLLAMSNIPIDDPIAEIWGRGLQGGYKIIEYTGSLPITINANGDALIDYRIYGADGGVGEPTENIFDGEMESGYYDNDGLKQSSFNWIRCKNFIRVNQNKTYHAVIVNNVGANGSTVFARCYNARKEYIGTTTQSVIEYYKEYAFNTLSDTEYVTFYISNSYSGLKIALFETTISKPYVPYGYKLPMTVSDGNTAQTVPVYIGENQLDSVNGVADYIDKANGKIVRMIGEYTFTGNESFEVYGLNACYTVRAISPLPESEYGTITMQCDHPTFTAISNNSLGYWASSGCHDNACNFRATMSQIVLRSTSNFATAAECKAYLKAQYDNGTPVKISYWLKTPVEEDPPVSFPDIPTIKGETIIDYDGTPKPSQMYVKYKGKG